ncbi:MAG: hypothetical protein ACXQS8_03270 [Candidatus Helarchaeales archaeon]
MKEISLNELAEWYKNANRKVLTSFRKDATKRITKVEKILSETTKSCIFLKNKTPNAEDVASKSALKFAEKVMDRIEQIQFIDKDDINFKTLSAFKLELERFLRDVYDSGKRLVKKLDRTYFQDVREINYLLTEVNQVLLKIKNMVEKKHVRVRQVENTLNQIERLQDLAEQILENNKELKELKGKLEEEEQILDNLKKDFSELKKNPTIIALEEKEQKLTSLRSEVVSKLGTFRKAFKKLHRLVSEGSFSMSAGAFKSLTDYSERPFETFISENENHPKLRAVLANIQESIQSKKLKLKEKKFSRKSEEILSSSKFFKIPEEYKKIEKELKELEIKLDEAGIKDELLAAKKQIQEQENRVNNLKISLRRVEDEQERLQNKIIELKNKIEINIKDTTNQSISINFS